MSAALKDAMMVQMQGSAALKAVLALDPNDSNGVDLAIYPARMNTVQSPVYPCLTFREEDDTPDGRFRPQPAQAGYKGVVEVCFDFEGWTDGANTRPLETIRDALNALFHQTAFLFPATGTPTGSVFYCERLTGHVGDYDPVLMKWFSLMRYRFRVQFL